MSRLLPQTVDHLRDEYPPGRRVIVDKMDDKHAPPAGTKGTVRFVDDAGQIHVRWDTGLNLALIFGVDEFRGISNEEN